MSALTEYLDTHTTSEPGVGADVHDRWIEATGDASAEALLELLAPHLDLFAEGTGIKEVTELAGDRPHAIALLGLGARVGLWELIIPATFEVTGDRADRLAEDGFIFTDGWWPGATPPERPGWPGRRTHGPGICPFCETSFDMPDDREPLIFSTFDRFPPERTVIASVPPGARVARFADDPIVHRCER